MAIKITLDIFSGRENPVITLTGNQEKEAVRLLKVDQALTDSATTPELPILGYRGMQIDVKGKSLRQLPKIFTVANGDVRGGDKGNFRLAASADFEDFIVSNVSKLKLPQTFQKKLKDEVDRFRALVPIWPPRIPPLPVTNPCACGPVYEPLWWNDPSRQPRNNCYNYSTNYRTDSFAQPGRGTGAIYSAITGAAVKAAAIRDALQDSPAADNRCPAEGHLVALVIAPSPSFNDFHWYRKGKDGAWTHKPGGTAATNLDNGGNVITDPRTANRGPYTQFTTFMVVQHGHIKIA